jgi:acetyltransferase-like isoleucine patch superfamily enzyme
MTVATTAKIHPNVRLGKNVIIEDFCIIGCPPSRSGEEDMETVIGDDSIIRSFTVIYAGNKIGSHFQTGNKANIREFNQIGDHVSIGTLSVIEHHVLIESNVRIHTQVFVPEYSILKSHCWIGPNAVLTNAMYPAAPDTKNNLKGPVLEEYCRIGANSTILPGVVIGANSLIGAGSVVTKNVEPNSVYAGVPAKYLKSIHALPYGEDSERR